MYRKKYRIFLNYTIFELYIMSKLFVRSLIHVVNKKKKNDFDIF